MIARSCTTCPSRVSPGFALLVTILVALGAHRIAGAAETAPPPPPPSTDPHAGPLVPAGTRQPTAHPDATTPQSATIEDLMARAKKLDPTRPTTVAISGGWGGISKVVEVMGVKYIKHGDTDKQDAEYPWQIILGTEETTTQATRGIYFDDHARGHLAPLEDGTSGANVETGWKHYAARPYLAGVI